MRQFTWKLVTFLVLSILFPLNVFAWNAIGHMVIATIAYEKLDPDVKAKVDKMTADFSKEYPSVNLFNQMAPWPDALRSQKIETFTHWHYIDVAFSNDGTPLKNLIDTDNVVWAVNTIEPIIANEKANPFERARFLAILSHLIGDLHQPLHTVSRISAKYPDGDRGGNLFMIQYHSPMQTATTTNLHHVWDEGVGIFTGDDSSAHITAIAHELTTMYPEKYFDQQAKDLKPDDWAKEGMTLATTIVYNTPENQLPSPSYLETGKQTAEQRAVLAGYRMGAILNQLLGHRTLA